MVTNTTLPLGSLPLARDAKAQGKIDFGLFPRGDAYKAECVLLNMNTKNEFLASLFQDLRFRQAFSLFVPRDKVNEIIYQGACVPTLGGFVLSGPSHPWYEPALINSEFIKRDLARANRLLDQILPNKDKDGYRLGPDGKPVFLPVISYTDWMDEQANMLVEDLPLIGLQGTFRSIAWGASGDLTRSGEWDVFYYQSSEAWENQLPERQNLAAPTGRFGENWAFKWWQWLDSGGTEGEEPPKQIKDNYAIWKQMLQEGDKAKLANLTKQWYRAQAAQIWTIPIVAFPPNFSVVKPNVGNWNQKTGRIYPSALFYKGQEL
jgi:peptide/nickel transport system substrate-binding protein